jgi:dipeptidyl aminopeptidase/acylaminoacyl peptidase
LKPSHSAFCLILLAAACASSPDEPEAEPVFELADVSIGVQEVHPFTVHDLLAMERISDPQVSPDGKWVAFTLRTTDMEANKGRTDIWVAAVDGSKVRRLTDHEANDSGARWMPDGDRVVFLSTRSGSSQVWSVSADGGEARQLTKLPLDVNGVLPFPDGEQLLLAIEVYPDAATLSETAKRDKTEAERPVKARIYDELMFRHWDSWEDGKRSHLFSWEIGSKNAPVDLMKGMDADSPTHPFGGMEEVAIHPRGSTVVFAAKSVGREAAWSTNVDLWSAPSDGSLAPKDLTSANPAFDNQPVFSPKGDRLAWLSMERAGYEADRQRVTIMDWPMGAPRFAAESWDFSASELAWSPDGATLFTTADNVGNHSVFAIDAATGAARAVVEKGHNVGCQQAGHRVVYLHDDLHGPSELYTCALDGSDVSAITTVNAQRVAAVELGDYEQFSFPGARGETVHGFVVKPAGFEAGHKYPVAFLIHGGPQGSFGDQFHYRWNPQTYAGAGYAAVFIDFHGSTGYGQAFCDAIRGDWGGAPYEDLMKGLDYALQHYDFLDGERVGALGASFGGYMINWIAGQTDRFQCLVSHDGNLDERAAYYMTEELWFPEWDHGGTPWQQGSTYAKHNPADYVQNWKTPILVIHGGLDYRVVDTQGMATFTAAQRMGVPSRLLYFPDENHWVLKPQNSALWHETVIAWLDQWLKGTPQATAKREDGRQDLLISIDQLRADRLGLSGYSR